MELKTIEGIPEMRVMLERCDGILKGKGTDYSGQPGSLDNFKTTAGRFHSRAELALGIQLEKQYSAVCRYIATGELASESIDERIADCVNYLLLLYKMVCERRAEAK